MNLELVEKNPEVEPVVKIGLKLLARIIAREMCDKRMCELETSSNKLEQTEMPDAA